ncbi:MAG: helix-turn-helix domain-containing protein [Clostridia bacterium]|nr:helix-turn-helix domain-containing protein [Clostridia bacterium]
MAENYTNTVDFAAEIWYTDTNIRNKPLKGSRNDVEQMIFGKRREYNVAIENLRLYLILDPPDTINDDDPACMTPHSHSYHELFVCGNGSITLMTSYGEIELKRGETLLIPGTYSHRRTKMSDDAKWFSIGFTYTKKAVRYDTEDLYSYLDGFAREDLLRKYLDDTQLFQKVQDIFLDPENIPKHIPAMKLFLILMNLKQMDSIDIKIGDKTRGLHGKTEIQSLLVLLDYFVYNKFTESITESEIAKQLYISERQLARIAKERYGMTLHRAIIEKRIDTAAKLLVCGDKTVEQISLAVGFQSKCCFYREFVKKYGMTPIEYRKKAGKESEK